MTRKLFLLISPILLISAMVMCSTTDEFVLEEVKEKVVPKDEKIPPMIAMITEIELEAGIQKYIYVRLDSKHLWLKEGLKGLIYNDVSQKELVGKFKIVKIFDDISHCEIIELYYPIQPKAIVVIEVDPRHHIK